VLSVLIAAVSFVLMEPVTYCSHRFVMHGLAERVHRSHHRPQGRRWEANDVFPVVFGSFAMLATLAAYRGLTGRWVLAVVVGVTLYGAAYALVHDVYIHRRLPLVRRRIALLERLAAAHRIHHLYQGEPFGMLFPVVPAELRERAAATGRDPLQTPSVAAPASGLRPPHVPSAS